MERSIVWSFSQLFDFSLFYPFLTLFFALNFPVNAAESDRSEVWWKTLRQQSSWNHTRMSSDCWDLLWNLVCLARLYGSHWTLRHKAYEADFILNGLLLSFCHVFLGLKVSRKWSDYLLQILGAIYRVTYIWNMFNLNESAVFCLSFSLDHPSRPSGT